MLKNVMIVATVAVAAYIVGQQSAARRGRDYEDLRHQLERLWNDPHARRSRKELAKRANRAAARAAKTARKRLA
jgi:hypothetical protein